MKKHKERERGSHYLQNVFLKEETLIMQSSYLCSPVIRCPQTSYLLSMNKHRSWGFLEYEYFARQSKIRHSILTKMVYHIAASDIQLFGNYSVQTSLNLQTDSSMSSTQLFCKHWSTPLYTRSAFLCTLVLGHAMLHLLPGYPNSEELEIGLCSILFIIPAKNNRIAGKSGSGISSQEPVIPHADWK